MGRRYQVAFIGAGGRSVAYAMHYAGREDIAVVAVADPSADHRRAMRAKSKLPNQPAEYDDWRDMLEEHADLDGLVIATPNHLHAQQAVAALERGLPLALEKPLATTKEDCERIIDAERANRGRTLIGFVLRSSPFYLKAHEIVASGAIGRVVAIQADELVGRAVTSLMNRNAWRRHERFSGGSMLEKCCHDMDLINWFAGCRPVAVHSFGGTLQLGPNAALPDHCGGCKVADDCLYYMAPPTSSNEDEGERVLHQFVREMDRCIYNIDKDVVDTQTVQIAYETGAVANFLLCFNAMGNRAGRNLHIVGTRGRVFGNINELCIFHHDNATDVTSKHDTTGDGSGHGGGDRRHAMELHRMMAEPDYIPTSGAAMGYLSAALCFAADQSRREAKQVSLRYRAGGYVDLVSA